MATVGIRELRQEASELVRRAEAGESITVTVNGHPAAVLAPLPRRRWVPSEELGDLFTQHHDPTWAADLERFRELFGGGVQHDPWEGTQA